MNMQPGEARISTPPASATTGGPLFGVAYYPEYLPADRDPSIDLAMMRNAEMNVIRIAESTWSTLEPRPGEFDFTDVDRALTAADAAGVAVIVGTPTYAVPSWLVELDPEVLARTPAGPNRYGARQLMDIANPTYRLHCERVIRQLIEHVAGHPAVIGYQVDNETSHYDVVSDDVQRAFVAELRDRFGEDFKALNETFGLAYWSNAIWRWEDFPDLQATINGSLAAEFDRFRRGLVAEFLAWQAQLVREYARPGQFVTHNFDLDWTPGHSYGLKSAADNFRSASALDFAGVDIYHPSANNLTGKEIAFGGDLTRALKGGAPYLVIETQAQGQTGWLPYPGQLRLQGHSHFASGAAGLMYWHWHSLHNSLETYWKGVLSQDLEPNAVYHEAAQLGVELRRIGSRLTTLRKRNRIALMVSNEALTALEWFTIEAGWPARYAGAGTAYNDVVRWVYDALFDLNLECDIVHASSERLADYELVIAPTLYSAPQTTIENLRAYVRSGGRLLTTFRSFVADEHVKVWDDRLPHGLIDILGASYQSHTRPDGVTLCAAGPLAGGIDGLPADAPAARACMELLITDGATALATYSDSPWGSTAAITEHQFGAGVAYYLGTMTSPEFLRVLFRHVAQAAGLWDWPSQLAERADHVRVRRCFDSDGRELVYLLNYGAEPVTVEVPFAAISLLDERRPAAGEAIELGAWDLAILERAAD